ncbi:hypothetical protein BDBG_02093 [Blastomyces gilchristii SLH14081]|uniref:Uncharacterized protein n=1 Tax=Blastomyces gilchristii (strain SLH14081) TaxID=559298 RepID=A0A179UCM8_BLAGS|nr:uncharacterized protein BDBG_02093 [Blastomyces gilchristii SLH14081]EQL38394.1 hypothetical protein BDFG_00013 [Blastomyces dermatitidis ATCC 26199]OAT05755.1 hypothetical protein BDBG_02093 [Blastomyces gilchristii SLH14081]
MPPKKNSLKNPTRPDEPDKHVLKTTHQRTKQQARRARPATKSRINRERQHRLALGGNTRSQNTLTQIDFVKRAQALLALDDEHEDDGLELEYIDRDNWDGEYGESGQSSKRRKGSGKRDSTGKKSGIAGRKEVDETDGEDDDRTLTQMGYVMRSSGWDCDGGTRHLHAGLGKRKGVPLMETIGEEPEAEMGDETLQKISTNCDSHIGRRSKKRKASEANIEGYPSQIVHPPPLNSGADISAAGPVTPRRPIRLVVPSSQSPDSPDLIISPRTFKEPPPKFPLAPLPHNVTPKKATSPLKNEYKTSSRVSRTTPYEIPESSFYSAGTCSSSRSCPEESVIGHETTPTTSPPLVFEEDSNTKLPTSSHDLQNKIRTEGQEIGPGDPDTTVRDAEKSKNRVIYETDAETEDEEVYDSIFHISGNDHDSWRTQSQLFHNCRSGNDDGDGDDNTLRELPTQYRNLGPETCHTLPENTLGSEPSILYYRKPMSLAFDPGSELDNIDTQRLAELFPAVEAENEECAISPLSTIPEEEHESQQGKGEDDTTSKPAENSQTNLVMNSQPAQHLNTAIEGNIPPPSSPPVVLVASSQQSDVGDAEPDQIACGDSQIGCQGLVTASQLLTDSMMESVPGPPIWMSSQHLSQEEQEDTG